MNQLLLGSSLTKIRDRAISLSRGSDCSLPRCVPGQSRYCRYRRLRSQNDHGKSDFHRNELLRSDGVSLAVRWPDVSLAPATPPLRLRRSTMLRKRFATYDYSSLEK